MDDIGYVFNGSNSFLKVWKFFEVFEDFWNFFEYWLVLIDGFRKFWKSSDESGCNLESVWGTVCD